MEELDERPTTSALSLLGVPQARWQLAKTADAWYAPGMNAWVSEQIGRPCSANWTVGRAEDGQRWVECTIRIGRQPHQVELRSGPCSSSLQALQDVMHTARQLPPDPSRNWGAESMLRVQQHSPAVGRDTWHRDLRTVFSGQTGIAPSFCNHAQGGLPEYTCTLRIGADQPVFEVTSQRHPTRGAAFDDAVAALIARIERSRAQRSAAPWAKPATAVAPQPVTALQKEASRAVNGVVQANALRVSFEAVRGGRHRCRIVWGKNGARQVDGAPAGDQNDAFWLALKTFKRAVWRESSAQPPADVARRPENGSSQELAAERLLSEATARWQVERDWLLKLPRPTHAQMLRLQRLSTFFVLLDPLRRLEIVLPQRALAVRQFGDELVAIMKEMSVDNQNARRATHLRTLVGKSVMEAGEPVRVTGAFENAMRATGLAPQQVIDDMVGARLLRRAPGGQLSMSTLGANLLERSLAGAAAPGTVGDALPTPLLGLLLDLRDTLKGEARQPGHAVA